MKILKFLMPPFIGTALGLVVPYICILIFRPSMNYEAAIPILLLGILVGVSIGILASVNIAKKSS